VREPCLNAMLALDRRLAPGIFDADWYVLRTLRSAIRRTLADDRVSLQGARVIDLGCGTRPYESLFAAAGAHYQGADIAGQPDITIRADGTVAAPDGQYDVVASFQVLEHVWDVATYLREARRLLKPGGWLLLSTHGTWLYHPHPGDYRRWTAEGLRREVEAHGFRLEKMLPVVGPLAWTTVFRSLGACHALKKLPLLGTLLASSAAALFNGRAWIEDRITPEAMIAANACVYVGLFSREG